MMERLKRAKEVLMAQVEAQLGHLESVNAEELGEVVDMVKDFEEAMYYCEKIEELKEKKKMLERENKMYEKYENMPIEVQVEWADRMKRHYIGMDPIYLKEMRDMDKSSGRMYYPRGGMNRGRIDGSRNYHEMYDPMLMNPYEHYDSTEMWQPTQYPREMIRDSREGKSPLARKHYMESKQTQKDTASQNKELEKYLNELADDISEMIENATPEQKIMMSQKLTHLGSKIK